MLILSCTESDIDDLKSFVSSENDFYLKVESMPEISNDIQYEYSSKRLRDPFLSPVSTLDSNRLAVLKSHPLGKKRNTEVLENYAIDELRMVGFIERIDLVWGLIHTPNNKVLRVREGDYIGRYRGLVLLITNEGIEIEEKIVNDENQWVKRNKSIKLSRVE